MLYFKASVVNWKDIRPWRPSSGLKEALFCGYSNLYFLANEYEAAKLRWAGGAERPVWRGNAPKKTGAGSARARMQDQNPLLIIIIITIVIIIIMNIYCRLYDIHTLCGW